MKKVLLLVLTGIALLTGFSLANGSAPSRAASDPLGSDAETALEQLRMAYVQEDSGSFFDAVSERGSFSSLDFKTQVTRHWTDFSQVDLLITVDHTLKSDGKAVLKTHWQKRAVRDRTGRSEMSEGRAEFVFGPGPAFKLLNIHGDSPF